MRTPADVLAVYAGVNWSEQGRKWHEAGLDPTGLFSMPFVRWCGLYLPAVSNRETVYKLGGSTSWKDVRAKLIERKKHREAESAGNS